MSIRGTNIETTRRRRKRAALVLLLLFLVSAYLASGAGDYITFQNLKENRLLLLAYVKEHYALSAVIFMGVYMLTAFFVPGAIAMTLTGGFLFGTVPGALWAVTGATFGAALAFLSTRYLAGGWIQGRHEKSLRALNDEIARHGPNYLLLLRIVPIMPFFLVNYLAGLTKMPLRSFLWTTLLGLLPGAFVYSFAGRKIGTIERPQDILSAELFAAFLLLAAFALLPVIVRLLRRIRRKQGPSAD
jgi:uncharacterized membrane protein YdjX (TVP38/TMEM64 family)